MSSDPPEANARAGSILFTTTAVITQRQLVAGARAATLRLTVTIGIAIILLLVTAAVPRTWVFVVFAGLFGLLLYLMPRRIYQGRLDGARTWTITVSEDEYRQASDRGESSAYAWANFSKAERVGEFWVLRAGRGVLTIPAAVFGDRETELFRALLHRKHLLRT